MSKFSVRQYDSITSGLKGVLIEFRALFFFYLIIFSICVFVFTISQVYPSLYTFLIASRSTPWGVITSLSIHMDVNHLVTNLLGLFLFILVFCFTNFYLLHNEISGRVRFFIVLIMVATILSNIFWIIIANLGSIGASGLVYASEGGVTGFSLLNTWDLYHVVRHPKHGEARGMLIVNLFVFLSVCAWMIFFTNSFLSYGRDVNILIHGSSFVLAFILAIEWENIRNHYNR